MINFHRFFFDAPPIVVISVPERGPNREYAEITAAVRGLTEQFKLKVVVDGSPCSIPSNTLLSSRQWVIFMNEMSRDQIEAIKEFQEVIRFMKKNAINDGVWEVLGGDAVSYVIVDTLYREMIMTNKPKDIIVAAIKQHVCSVLLRAYSAVISCGAHTNSIIKLCREQKTTQMEMLELMAHRAAWDGPDKVFRSTYDAYVEPTSSAVSLVICNRFNNNIDVIRWHEKLFAPKIQAE